MEQQLQKNNPYPSIVLKYDPVYETLFPKEQREALASLFVKIEDIIEKETEKVDARLRNHRHQLDKNYSAKPEF